MGRGRTAGGLRSLASVVSPPARSVAEAVQKATDAGAVEAADARSSAQTDASSRAGFAVLEAGVVSQAVSSRAPSATAGGGATTGGDTAGVGAEAVQAGPKAVLPAGWKMVVSKSTGKPYYYKKSTKETRWTIPGPGD